MPSLRYSVGGIAGPAPTSSEAPPGAWPPDASRLLFVTLLALFALVVVRTAWLSDDAFIALRTVDILVNGYGPRWNVAERVQAYTHPLRMMALALPYAVTREPYPTTLLLSLSCAFAAVWIFTARLSSSVAATALGLTVLIFSKAFVEY
jgi:arabinofuranosyltransferase